MQHQLNELHHQRGRLQERIAMQRQSLAMQLAPVGHALNVGDRFSHAVSDGKAFVQQYPLAVAAVVGLVLVVKPQAFLRWTQRGLMVWRTWRSVRGILPDFLLRQILK